MPIHFKDLDILSQIEGLNSALIVPCIMCPAATIAVRDNKPFIQLFKSFLNSAPFDKYIRTLQSQLKEKGVNTEVFESNIPHQWFMCMWTSGRRRKLRETAKQYDAVIVFGCDSSTATARDAVKSMDCKVIEGMKVAGIMNAKLSFSLPCNISFEDCKIIPISQQKKE